MEILSLSDHLATVEEYLNKYQLTSNDRSGENLKDPKGEKRSAKLDREGQFDRFSTYLVSTCYPKIRKRLLSKLSTNLLTLLSKITGPQLERCLENKAFQEPVLSKKSNVELCRFIYALQSSYDFRTMVENLKDNHYPRQQSEPRTTQKASNFFTNVYQTFELVMAGKNPSDLPILYTRETFVDFHYLLLLVLDKYRNAILQFYDGTNNGGPNDGHRRDLKVYSLVLWRLAHSSILRCHLICLRTHGLLSQGSRVERGNEAKAGGGDEAIGGGKESDLNSDDEVGGQAEESDLGSDDGVKDEMAAMQSHQDHKDDPALMIQRWICLIVSHLQSLNILSSFAASSPRGIRIQHIVAARSELTVPQDWTAVLKRAVAAIGGTLLSRLDELEDTILEKINQNQVRRTGIFSYFKGKEITSGGGQIHCAAAAALVAVIHASLGEQHGVDVRPDLSSSSLSDALHRNPGTMWPCRNFVALCVGTSWVHFTQTDLVSRDVILL